MLVLLLDLLLIAMGVCIYFRFVKKEYNYEIMANLKYAMVIIGLFFILFSVISSLYIADIIEGRDIEKQIEMYKEENQAIEQQINALVENYMEYEGETFKEYSVDESMMLMSLYPELKSDQLVVKQMEIYSENNNMIKKLKMNLIDINSSKWILYFGGK